MTRQKNPSVALEVRFPPPMGSQCQARKVGYKAKQGYSIYRVRVKRGDRKKRVAKALPDLNSWDPLDMAPWSWDMLGYVHLCNVGFIWIYPIYKRLDMFGCNSSNRGIYISRIKCLMQNSPWFDIRSWTWGCHHAYTWSTIGGCIWVLKIHQDICPDGARYSCDDLHPLSLFHG